MLYSTTAGNIHANVSSAREAHTRTMTTTYVHLGFLPVDEEEDETKMEMSRKQNALLTCMEKNETPDHFLACVQNPDTGILPLQIDDAKEFGYRVRNYPHPHTEEFIVALLTLVQGVPETYEETEALSKIIHDVLYAERYGENFLRDMDPETRRMTTSVRRSDPGGDPAPMSLPITRHTGGVVVSSNPMAAAMRSRSRSTTTETLNPLLGRRGGTRHTRRRSASRSGSASSSRSRGAHRHRRPKLSPRHRSKSRRSITSRGRSPKVLGKPHRRLGLPRRI